MISLMDGFLGFFPIIASNTRQTIDKNANHIALDMIIEIRNIILPIMDNISFH